MPKTTKRENSQDGPKSRKKRKDVRWDSVEPTEISASEPEQAGNLDKATPKNDEELMDDQKSCLSITSFGGKIGAAFYDPFRSTVSIVEDTLDSYFDLTKMVFEQAKPDYTITSSKSDHQFVIICREYMEESGASFQIRPAREFSPQRGREKLLSLPLFSESSSYLAGTFAEGSLTSGGDYGVSRNADNFMQAQRSQQEDPTVQKYLAMIRVANYGSDSAPQCVSAIGALIDYLCRIKAVGDLDDEGVSGLDVQNIEILSIEKVMQINADALNSLQIFDNEGHASVHSNQSKEGLSLFATLNHTRTKLGRALLRQWFLRPLLSLPAIASRHDAVECFLRGENWVCTENMQTHLRGTNGAPRALGLLKAGKATLNDWASLVKFTYNITLLMDAASDIAHGQGIAVLQRLHRDVNVVRLKDMGAQIDSTIDWDSSDIERRICVCQNVDKNLDEMKRTFHGLDSLLSKIALQMQNMVSSDWAETLNVLYFPQLGYLICVPLKEEWTRGDFEAVDGWTYQFSSEDSVYFKSQEMHDLDEHIGDLQCDIAGQEIEIIHALSEDVVRYEAAILLACETCAELDCLLSLALAAKVQNYGRPVMTEENVIEIKKGRHPLYEQVTDLFIPNDALLFGGAGVGIGYTDEASSSEDEGDTPEDEEKKLREKLGVIICTGSNASGKSVYLKQTALIVFMAQIGSFVPAEYAKLGIVDKIFTRLQTRESVSKIQSAFMIDLNQVSFAIRNATARSLILLDEFGKGTVPTDGAGLFCGVIDNWLQLGANCPKVMAATHFHEIFSNGLLDLALPIGFVHMEAMLSATDPSGQNVLVTSSSALGTTEKDVQISYLYRVAKGLSLNSHATKCALLYGISKNVVQRAEYVSELVSRHEVARLLEEDITSAEMDELEEAERVCRAFVAWNLGEETEDVKEELGKVLHPLMET